MSRAPMASMWGVACWQSSRRKSRPRRKATRPARAAREARDSDGTWIPRKRPAPRPHRTGRPAALHPARPPRNGHSPGHAGAHRPYHLGQYPCPLTVATGAAQARMTREKAVSIRSSNGRLRKAGHCGAEVKILQRQHAGGSGHHHSRGRILTVPGKDAPAVGRQQTCRQQVATGTQYPFCGAASRRGKLRRIQSYSLTHRCGRHLLLRFRALGRGRGARVHCPDT